MAFKDAISCAGNSIPTACEATITRATTSATIQTRLKADVDAASLNQVLRLIRNDNYTQAADVAVVAACSNYAMNLF